jgi:Cys-tRNA(Pro)/Cys-tRNA(Cys) deacylase
MAAAPVRVLQQGGPAPILLQQGHLAATAAAPTSYVRAVAGTGTPATALLAKQKVEHRVHTYTHRGGQAYGPEAAEELGLEPAQVFKTLVVPVSATLDLKALAAAVGGKRARMADVAAAERATGYVAGGISPLGQRKRLRTVVDTSAQALSTMFCSGGRRGLEVELAPTDLARLTGATFAPIAARPAPAPPRFPVRAARDL